MIPNKYNEYQKDLDFIEQYVHATNAANGSKVDANSNVANKNIATMAPEIHKINNLSANRLKMYQKLTELYGEELATEYIRQLEEHEIYRHDESGTPVGTPYCVSITMYPFLLHGLKELGGTSVAPKNLDSYCGSFINLVFAVAAQFAGAVATPEFLSYFTYFCAKDYGDDFYLRGDEVVDFSAHKRTIKQMIESKFQQVVYSLNQPAAARGSQSVFWNVAYFDTYYFHSLFEEFIFPDGTAMTDLWEGVKWIQKLFMEWFNNERLKNILTFPVESFSLLNDGESYKDEEAADWCAYMLSKGHSFFIYNSDSVDSLASCCFAPDTKVKIQINNLATEFTIKEVYDKYQGQTIEISHLNGWSRGTPIKLAKRQMYEITINNNITVTATDNHLFPTAFRGNVQVCDLNLDDYIWCNFIDKNTNYIKNDDNYYYKITAIKKVPSNDYEFVYCFEMEDKNNPYFTLANGVVTHNCRLRNGMQDNTFSYSLGAGGISTGSKCVITMNMNRLVQNALRDGSNISEKVREQTEKIHKYLNAFNEIVKDMYKNHMLQVYDAGFINLEKQYLTVGM